jgi:acetamidase/formamidase
MTDVIRYRPAPQEYAWTFGGRPPVLTVPAGAVLELFTEDCFGGQVRGVDDLPSRVCEFPYLNPVTGPVFVEGAEPGDTLALHFAAIEPARDWAVSSTFPHFGALTSTHQTATLQDPLEERVWRYDVDTAAGTVTYRARNSELAIELPLDPMHGTVGVAPAGFEARQTITPDAHGGNLDSPEVRAGTTVYLGVNQPGALFGIGDGHCRQGQGEVCGTGVEAAMITTVVVEVVKGAGTPWPRFETDAAIMSTGSARPLEDAYRISQHDLVTWVAAEHGIDLLDAYQLVSQAGEAPVANVCDPNYTFVAKLDKRYLPPVRTYAGVHDRLRATAATYLAQR